eukprot:COSAG01_NODE_29278_length_641_cov_0.918819_1_plen_79_part_00
MLEHSENARQGVVQFGKLRRPKEGYRDNQRRLMAITTPQQYYQAIQYRKEQLFRSLSDDKSPVAQRVISSYLGYTCNH